MEFAASILSASDSESEDRICTVSALTHKLHINHTTFGVLTEVTLKSQAIRRVMPNAARIVVSSCVYQVIRRVGLMPNAARIVVSSCVHQEIHEFFISNFCGVLNVVCFLLGNSPASGFYIPAFRNNVYSIFIGG
jgi:hypothetical protein